MHNELSLRLYEPGDETGIIELFNASFPVKIDRAHWQWKYADNPAGFPLISVASQGTKIVGHICLNPVLSRIKGKTVRSAQAVDMMVSKDYRGTRLIVQLAKLCTEHLDGGYADFSFGFPVPRFRPLTRRFLGWSEAVVIPQWVKVTNPVYVFRRPLSRFALLQKYARRVGSACSRLRWPALTSKNHESRISRISHFDQRLDHLWDDVSSEFTIATIRDCRYLNWRYSHPNYHVYAIAEPDRIDGFVALRTTMWEGWHIGSIVDLLARDNQAAYRLLRAALDHFFQVRTDLIRCWMTKSSPYCKPLRQLGFIPRPSPFQLMIRSHTSSISKSFLQESTHWYVTLGDSDGI